MNYYELERTIKDKGLKKNFIADKIGTSRASFYLKLSGERQFNQSEIMAMKEVLNLTDEEFVKIFFDKKVDESSTEEA